MNTNKACLVTLVSAAVFLLFFHASPGQELNRVGPTTKQITGSSSETDVEASLTPAQELNRQALEAMGTKDWKKAFTLLTEAMKADDKEVQTYLNFGVAHYMRKEYQSCEHALLKALEVDPKNDKAHYLYSKVIILKGERELAISSAEKAFELSDSKEWTYQSWLAELHQGDGRYQQAADCYSHALRILEENLESLATGITKAESREIITDTWVETDIYYDPISGRMNELEVQKYQTESGKAPDRWYLLKTSLESNILEIKKRKDEALKLANR